MQTVQWQRIWVQPRIIQIEYNQQVYQYRNEKKHQVK